ncbi:hypothetical protein AB1303_13530 [Saccharolobus solfataricus]|uniref:Uncharacterized protein n=2 Tax=Saccharolobus solfataricus TaxID=2287 RepID=Q7LXI1_SACS2|nr:hypothetical protein [Saccharolobus solfataricus]AAK41090.1 Hypothetical protein SSO0792 [Saccharolobus solfataricus P2]QPG49218.1 hypothetical protein HFC64_04540 [Saccharolobus solfataricus]CAB57511.1 hypothetical protein [Saccharolobus solfataricus P2]SAI84380.1 uncharacterised protein [Saccharolobus solfataricus]
MSEAVYTFDVTLIKPTVFKFTIGEEIVTVMLYLIPQAVIISEKEEEGKKLPSVVSMGTLTVVSNKPKMGELCSADKFSRHTPFIPKIEIVSNGVTEVKVNYMKIKISAKVTNVNVYPDLRDSLGNPCVNVSWIQLISVE